MSNKVRLVKLRINKSISGSNTTTTVNNTSILKANEENLFVTNTTNMNTNKGNRNNFSAAAAGGDDYASGLEVLNREVQRITSELAAQQELLDLFEQYRERLQEFLGKCKCSQQKASREVFQKLEETYQSLMPIRPMKMPMTTEAKVAQAQAASQAIPIKVEFKNNSFEIKPIATASNSVSLDGSNGAYMTSTTPILAAVTIGGAPSIGGSSILAPSNVTIDRQHPSIRMLESRDVTLTAVQEPSRMVKSKVRAYLDSLNPNTMATNHMPSPLSQQRSLTSTTGVFEKTPNGMVYYPPMGKFGKKITTTSNGDDLDGEPDTVFVCQGDKVIIKQRKRPSGIVTTSTAAAAAAPVKRARLSSNSPAEPLDSENDRLDIINDALDNLLQGRFDALNNLNKPDEEAGIVDEDDEEDGDEGNEGDVELEDEEYNSDARANEYEEAEEEEEEEEEDHEDDADDAELMLDDEEVNEGNEGTANNNKTILSAALESGFKPYPNYLSKGTTPTTSSSSTTAPTNRLIINRIGSNGEIKLLIPSSSGGGSGGSSILATSAGTSNGSIELKTDVSQLVTPVNQGVWGGTPFMPKRPHLTREERMDIIDRLKKNECGARIARDYGITKQAVSAIKRRAQLMGFNFDDYSANYYVSLTNNTFAPLASQVLLPQSSTSPNDGSSNNDNGDNGEAAKSNTINTTSKIMRPRIRRQRGVIRVPIMPNVHSIATTAPTISFPVTVKSISDNIADTAATTTVVTAMSQQPQPTPSAAAAAAVAVTANESPRSFARKLANDNSLAARQLKQQKLNDTILKQGKLLAQFAPRPQDLVLPVNPVAIIKSKLAKNLKLVKENGEEVMPTGAQIRLEPKQISRTVVSGASVTTSGTVSVGSSSTKPTTTVIVTSDGTWKSGTSKILVTSTTSTTSTATTSTAATPVIAASSSVASASTAATTATATTSNTPTTTQRQPLILSNLLKGTGSYVPGMYTTSGVNGNNNIKINIRRINLAGPGVTAISGTPVTTTVPGGPVLKIVTPSELAAAVGGSGGGTSSLIKCTTGKTVFSSGTTSLLLNNKGVISGAIGKSPDGTCTFNPVTKMITVSKTAPSLVVINKAQVLKPAAAAAAVQPVAVETTSKVPVEQVATTTTTPSIVATTNEPTAEFSASSAQQVVEEEVQCVPQPQPEKPSSADQVTDQLVGDDAFFDQIMNTGEGGEEDLEDEDELEDDEEDDVEEEHEMNNVEDENNNNNNNQMYHASNLDMLADAAVDDEHSRELLDEVLMKNYQTGGELVNLQLEEGELDAQS